MREWLESVKAGDRVIVVGRHGGSRSIRQVSRTTATRIMLGADLAFRRKDGYEVSGGPWSGMQLEEGTPEALETVFRENRRAHLARALNHRNWDNVRLETLEEITALLDDSDKPKE